MQKKENKKELEMAQKNSSTFKKLMQSKEFIEDILNTNDGKEIIDKFEAQGIDINKIQFSKLCNILVQRLKSDDANPNLEVSSIDSPISVDYEKRVDKTIIKFEDWNYYSVFYLKKLMRCLEEFDFSPALPEKKLTNQKIYWKLFIIWFYNNFLYFNLKFGRDS